MTNKEAINVLVAIISRDEVVLRDTDREAIKMAIRALRQVDRIKKIGKLGGQATVRKYGKKQMRAWAKLGGRPKKKGMS